MDPSPGSLLTEPGGSEGPQGNQIVAANAGDQGPEATFPR